MYKLSLITILFIISFGLYSQEADAVSGASYKILSGFTRDGIKLRAFIINNSEKEQYQLTSILKSEGFIIIDVVLDNKEGFEKYTKQSEEVDILFLGSDDAKNRGLTTLNKILKYNSSAIVIMIVNRKKETRMDKNIKKGAKGYITTPFSNLTVRTDLLKILQPR
ncbi:MAG: response regulator [Spirochaetaceae bacterium]